MENSFPEARQPESVGVLMKQVSRVTAPVREQVAQMLRQSITTGELRPGQRVIEREICEATGASRTSVREALRQLESERLITNLPPYGPVVSVIEEDEALSLFETRATLEAMVAAACAERASNAELAALAQSVTALKEAAATGNPEEISEAVTVVYERQFAGAKNVVAEGLIRTLRVRVMTLPMRLDDPGRAAVVADEVSAIAEAIIARDPEKASNLVTAHALGAGQVAIERIRASRGSQNRP